jgi:hypothetical protein
MCGLRVTLLSSLIGNMVAFDRLQTGKSAYGRQDF